MAPHPAKTARIAVVGAGEFGISTTYHLLESGYTDITLYDRVQPPVPDGSSVDISRIVRADYDDEVYAKMVVESLELWKTQFKDFYHPCGLLCMTPAGNPKYLEDALRNVEALGLPVTKFASGPEASKYLKLTHTDAMSGLAGYLSHDAGWAYAAKATEHLFNLCTGLGAKFIAKEIKSLVYGDDKSTVTGLSFTDGSNAAVDFVIVSAGAWTDSLVDTSSRTLATGQPVGYIQLTEEEYEKTKHLPIYINFVSGFYVFPPHPESRLVKAARHSYGYTNLQLAEDGRYSSKPPTVDYSQGELPPQRTALPKDADECLRIGLYEYLGPEIAKRAYTRARICWYNDTPTKDFLFDYKPGVSNLFVATGGSGHGFKFLPVIGKYAVGCLEHTLSSDLLTKFGWRQQVDKKEDASRGGTPLMSLDDAELA
ncbi:FAD dependent oxidoreductase [Lipomyces arxii]|uniref:FAD dependent oxidoreductase n=1 Tax=Lipomyces arxii TaxID=56418 RepID=UPI0034CE3A15